MKILHNIENEPFISNLISSQNWSITKNAAITLILNDFSFKQARVFCIAELRNACRNASDVVSRGVFGIIEV